MSEPRQPHIEELLTVPFRSINEIQRLDVAVDDSLGMRMFQTTSDLGRATNRMLDTQSAVVLDEIPQVAALDVFHHQVVDAGFLPGIERGYDIVMLQLGNRFDLALKSPNRFGIRGSFPRGAASRRRRDPCGGAEP